MSEVQEGNKETGSTNFKKGMTLEEYMSRLNFETTLEEK
jgi:hypothetical protein